MRTRKLSIALVAAALGVLALGAMPALGSDHRDSPLTKDSPKADIGDLYVWKLPNGNVVYAMTVNPLTTPADTGKLSLDPNVVYAFRFDTTGDNIADGAIKFVFSGNGPVQDVTVYGTIGGVPSDAVSLDASGVFLASGKTSVGSAVNVFSAANGQRYFVGPRDEYGLEHGTDGSCEVARMARVVNDNPVFGERDGVPRGGTRDRKSVVTGEDGRRADL